MASPLPPSVKHLPSPATFNWNVLGFGLCRMWITQWMVLPIVFLQEQFANTRLIYFFAMVAVCFFVFLFSGKPVLRMRTTVLIVSFAATVIGIACFTVGAYTASPVCLMLGLICDGIGAALLQILWGDRFTRLSAESADFYAVCAMLFGSALLLMAYKTTSLDIALLLHALVPLCSFILLFRDFKDGDWLEPKPSTLPKASLEKPIQVSQISVRRLCVSIFVFVLIYNFVYRYLFAHFSLSIFGFSVRHVVNLCVMIILFVIAIKTKWFNRLNLYRASFPILIGALLLVLVMPEDRQLIISFIASFGYKLFDVLFWCLLVSVARVNAQDSWRVFGLGMMANFAGMGLGMFLSAGSVEALGFLYSNVTLVNCVLIFLLVVIFIQILPESLFAQLTALVGHAENEHRETKPQILLEDRCVYVAREGRLTPRESEVLLLLAQGRTQEVIAEKLCIGKGTAHSHILHVYQKLHVHSQQELIELVSSRSN